MNNFSQWPSPRDAQVNPNVYRQGVLTSSPFVNRKIDQYASGATSTEGLIVLYDQRIADIQKEFIELKKIVLKLMEKENESVKEEIQLRDISYHQAKAEITEYFKKHHGKNYDPSDLQELLAIEITMVIEICEELEKEGRIKAV